MSSLKILHYVTLNQYLWYLHVLNGPEKKLYQHLNRDSYRETVRCVLNDCKYGFIASLTLKLLTQGLCKRSSDNLTPENDYLGNKSRLRREYGSLTMRAQPQLWKYEKNSPFFERDDRTTQYTIIPTCFLRNKFPDYRGSNVDSSPLQDS